MARQLFEKFLKVMPLSLSVAGDEIEICKRHLRAPDCHDRHRLSQDG